MLISRRLGSFTFLGALVVDLELGYDSPHQANHCGSCTRCLEACPTGAFAGAYQLDSRRCISYWTIEHRGIMPDEPASQLDGWVFGCDICQDVCPWNRKAPAGRLAEFDTRVEWTEPDLVDWLSHDETEWTAILRGAAQKRAHARASCAMPRLCSAAAGCSTRLRLWSRCLKIPTSIPSCARPPPGHSVKSAATSQWPLSSGFSKMLTNWWGAGRAQLASVHQNV